MCHLARVGDVWDAQLQRLCITPRHSLPAGAVAVSTGAYTALLGALAGSSRARAAVNQRLREQAGIDDGVSSAGDETRVLRRAYRAFSNLHHVVGWFSSKS